METLGHEVVLGFSFLLSFFLVLYGTPIARSVAQRYHLVDIPDGRLKRHREPVPYMGGVIVYFAFIAPVSLAYEFNRPLLGIMFAGSILVTVGLFDDLKAMTPGIKFLFQILATYILLKSGVFLSLLFLPSWLNTLLSFFLILTCINAYNIVDILDGLASGLAGTTLLTLFVFAIYTADYMTAMLALSLGGALLGFLRFNWEPARIYLGDAGSQFIGMVCGALAIMTRYSENNSMAFLAGVLLIGIPLYDVAYVMILRLAQGKSPFFGSPDHLALRLRKRFDWSVARTVGVLILIQIVLCGLALACFFMTPTITLWLVGGTVVISLGIGVYLARVKMS